MSDGMAWNESSNPVLSYPASPYVAGQQHWPAQRTVIDAALDSLRKRFARLDFGLGSSIETACAESRKAGFLEGQAAGFQAGMAAGYSAGYAAGRAGAVDPVDLRPSGNAS